MVRCLEADQDDVVAVDAEDSAGDRLTAVAAAADALAAVPAARGGAARGVTTTDVATTAAADDAASASPTSRPRPPSPGRTRRLRRPSARAS